MAVAIAAAILVAVLFSLHFTWSMCSDFVDIIVAANFASDPGALAGAIPLKKKDCGLTRATAGASCTSSGLSVPVCRLEQFATIFPCPSPLSKLRGLVSR